MSAKIILVGEQPKLSVAHISDGQHNLQDVVRKALESTSKFTVVGEIRSKEELDKVLAACMR